MRLGIAGGVTQMEIFTQSGLAFASRWVHFLAGITWIGLLYYFNFVQTPAFALMGADARSEALRNITWRALWWFRWAAIVTLLSGLLILGFQEQFTAGYFTSPAGVSIYSGLVLGAIMAANVWMVIWPAQKIVIGSARAVAEGGPADPDAAAAARRGALASRMNTIFSIPLLFFMGATSHFAGSTHFAGDVSGTPLIVYWVILLVVAAALEVNALGRIGGYAAGPLKTPYDSIRAALITGFALTAVFYALFEILFRA
jgi:uncharacterized membrane protein